MSRQCNQSAIAYLAYPNVCAPPLWDVEIGVLTSSLRSQSLQR